MGPKWTTSLERVGNCGSEGDARGAPPTWYDGCGGSWVRRGRHGRRSSGLQGGRQDGIGRSLRPRRPWVRSGRHGRFSAQVPVFSGTASCLRPDAMAASSPSALPDVLPGTFGMQPTSNCGLLCLPPPRVTFFKAKLGRFSVRIVHQVMICARRCSRHVRREASPGTGAQLRRFEPRGPGHRPPFLGYAPSAVAALTLDPGVGAIGTFHNRMRLFINELAFSWLLEWFQTQAKRPARL